MTNFNTIDPNNSDHNFCNFSNQKFNSKKQRDHDDLDLSNTIVMPKYTDIPDNTLLSADIEDKKSNLVSPRLKKILMFR